VLNLLCGLNPRFANTADIIANSEVLPSFILAHNKLRLKEISLVNDTKVSTDTALTTASSSPSPAPAACTSPSCRSSSFGPNPNRYGDGGGRGKGNDGRNGGGGRTQQQFAPSQDSSASGGRCSTGVQPTGPWFCMNPLTNPPQWQLPLQWCPPMAPLPQPHTAFAPLSVTGGWDQGALIASLIQMALQGGVSPWVLGTRATSCMSSSDGILLSRLPHSSSFITVGNGASIPVSSRGTSIIPIADHNFQLNNVLVAPHLVRNLLSVR